MADDKFLNNRRDKAGFFRCPSSDHICLGEGIHLYNESENRYLISPVKIHVQKDSPREKLINNIRNVFEREFPDSQLSDFDISRIIYNDPKFIKDNFLHSRKIKRNSKPDLLVLMKIIYYIQSLSINDIAKFKKMKDNTTKILDNIKIDIRKIILDFIFDNPYSTKYIKQDNRTKHQRENNYWRPEFELFLDLWYAASLNNKEPITIKIFQQTIGNPAFSTPTKIGKCNPKYFYNLLKKMPSLFPQISLKDFKQVHRSVKNYIRIRNLRETYRNYSIYWEDELTKKGQITILLLRDLGVEVLTLKKIPSISFNKNLDLHDPIKYQRHHIFPNDKDSINPNRLVLAVLTSHTSLEGLTNLIISLIKDRIKSCDNIPQYYKNNIKNAQQLWNEFLKRRDIIKNMGIEYFFRTYYPDVVNRFYKNVPRGHLKLAIKQVIKNWLKDGNPEPVLPKYLWLQLI
ncbi:MAG: hypothetical protein ACFE8A_05255 [Candidatus Hodarchaeota archaeon]